MSTSDNPQVVDPASVSPQATIIRYGLIGGLIFVVYGLLGNILGFAKPSGGISAIVINGLVFIVLYVGLMVMAVRKHRDQDLGGYIPFGRAFLVGLGVAVIAGVISGLFNYLYMSFIEPDYLTNMVGEMEEMYANMGMSEETIEIAMERVRKSLTPTKMLTNAAIGSVVMGGIVSLIVSAIMKKKPPEVVV